MSAASAPAPLLRPFHRPWLWCALWLAMIAAVAATCLMPAKDLPPTPFDHFDKLEHFCAYLALSGYGGMLLARSGARALAALAMIALGVGLEFAQAALTDSRSGDVADAVANSLGAVAGLALGRTPAALWLLRLDAWLARRCDA